VNPCQVSVGFQLLQILSQIRKRHDHLQKNVLAVRYVFQPESSIRKKPTVKKTKYRTA
jgi:hypothetical protein